MQYIKYLNSFVLIISCVIVSSCESYVEDDFQVSIQDCDPNTSFINQVKPIIDNNCVSCHNGNQFPDLRTYNGVSTNSEIVEQQVVNRTMPIGGSLTNEEIDLITCWIENGSLNN
ncbi:cytochrome c [Winogradskyella sp.]|uniref:c-type cytochrome n=1 Tax=Winogradskyella sp. TaxID=1883156 RepID=UPI0025E83711|nr:cytochrome c [Winogradskyella sp.]